MKVHNQIFTAAVLLAACSDPQPVTSEENQRANVIEYPAAVEADTGGPLFTLLDPLETGIHFVNSIEETEQNNILKFDYMYNGGGVAIGDINNDGLADIYFCGNMTPNKLYLNKGGFRFEDITQKSGTQGSGWSAGVCMADVNGDGLLDIYVCRSFDRKNPAMRKNLLFINQGNLRFTEKAEEWGIDDPGFSVQAAFFDMDLDGDLDLFVSNHPGEFGLEFEQSLIRHRNPAREFTSNLYRNNGGRFTMVTKDAGVFSYGFGLGLAVGDVTRDGYPDIYVANDYEEPDFYFVNNGDGTFTESVKDYFPHTSTFGMGIDLADFNNDTYLDLLELDMMAEDNYRQKVMMSAMQPDVFWYYVKNGFHYQYMRNTLQLNNGNGHFSDIGFFAGVPYTDWSWAGLFADFNNDGLKDLVVSNGFRRDSRNKDARHKIDEEFKGGKKATQIYAVLSMFPETKLLNYYFENNGNLTFSSKAAAYGLAHKSFSNGTAYGDLDNDGDVEIVFNNLLDTAFVYRNEADETRKNHYLKIALEGTGMNTKGVGAKVTMRQGERLQYLESSPVRGYLSSVDPVLHFGLGAASMIDEITVEWPGGAVQTVTGVKPGQLLVVRQADAKPAGKTPPGNMPLFTGITAMSGVNYMHVENEFNDFKKEILLPHKMSQFGPGVAAGNVNGDALDDFYAGGAAGQAGELWIQQEGNTFSRQEVDAFKTDKEFEDLGSLFLDADGDKDLDLFVVSGGNEFQDDPAMLTHRLYVNDGKGNFTRDEDAFPGIAFSGSCVTAADYDADGDPDLFIGGRVVPGKYPLPASSALLENRGGAFKDVTANAAPGLKDIGMVTSAAWSDFDMDKDLDLVITGEWMPVTFLRNDDGVFSNVTSVLGFGGSAGWWNRVVQFDFDHDGDMDYVAGNLGLNYKYKAAPGEPTHIYAADFDNTGTLDIVLGYYNNGVCFPVRGRQCSSDQMPFIKEKFSTYDEFGKADLATVYGDGLKNALHYEAQWFASSLIENKGGRFVMRQLPDEAQFAPVFGILTGDFSGDGADDILLAGNLYVSEVETGRADAGTGVLLLGSGDGKFSAESVKKSGFFAPGDVRDMAMIRNPDGTLLILVMNNNAPMQVFRLNTPPAL